MKIVILGDYPVNSKIINDGVEAVLFNLVEGLQKVNGLDIHVITCRKEIDKAHMISRGVLKIHYILGRRCLNRIFFDALDVKQIRNKIKEIKPDIIHSHDQGKYTFAALKSCYPVLVTISTISSAAFKFENTLIDLLGR